MSDLAIFVFGCIVSLIWGSALAFLIYAEWLDGRK